MVKDIVFSRKDGKYEGSFAGGSGIVQVERESTGKLDMVSVYLVVKNMTPVLRLQSMDANFMFELSSIPADVTVLIVSDSAVKSCKFVYDD